ncbi:MAG: restriction endonuclease subunit S [Peptococcaceae bacterium]|nr:restriction endonuclease subunit S [Peptococcaceae bacterium]
MSKWEMVRLGDVLDYEQPTKYIVESTNYSDEFKTPVLTAGQSFILGYTDETENIFTNYPVIIFDDFTAAIKYVDFSFKVKSSAMKILKASQAADIKYLFYYMGTIKTDTQLHKRYWISKYANIEIPLPPLPVQQKIADILNRASALIEKRKAQIDKLDLLVKSRFVEMFGDPVTNPMGWERGTVRNIVAEVKYGTSNPANDGGQYPYLRMNNITYSGQLDMTDLKYINMPDSQLEKYAVRKGDVLFNRTNSKELVGKTCVFDSNEKMIIAGYIIRVRTNNRAIPVYLSAVLNSDYGKLTLRAMCKTIIGQANINAQELQDIEILIPPLPLQHRFADYVRATDKSKFAMQRGLDKLELLYKSLMQKCFAGELFN